MPDTGLDRWQLKYTSSALGLWHPDVGTPWANSLAGTIGFYKKVEIRFTVNPTRDARGNFFQLGVRQRATGTEVRIDLWDAGAHAWVLGTPTTRSNTIDGGDPYDGYADPKGTTHDVVYISDAPGIRTNDALSSTDGKLGPATPDLGQRRVMSLDFTDRMRWNSGHGQFDVSNLVTWSRHITVQSIPDPVTGARTAWFATTDD